MKYNILVLRNRYNEKVDIENGINWLRERVKGVDFIVTQKDSDIDLEFQMYGNDKKSGCAPSHLNHTVLKTVVPEDTYNAVVVFYGNKPPTKRVSVTHSIPIYSNTSVIYIGTKDKGGKTTNNELFHAFIRSAIAGGAKIEDPMDKVTIDGVVYHYYNDGNMRAKHSNRTIALERLSPYWESICGFKKRDRLSALLSILGKNKVSESKTSNFESFIDYLLEDEGGYVNNVNDKGGETKYGISKRSFPREDIKNLTKERAKEIYKSQYWDKCRCDELPENVAYMLFDTAVNAGATTAIRYLQEALEVTVDGKLGPVTLGAAKKMDENKLATRYSIVRLERYTKMKDFIHFGRGWTNRIAKTMKRTLW